MIVDAHSHVFARVSDTYPRDTHGLFPAELEFTAERYLDILGKNGVDKAVLVPLSQHDEYIRYALTTYPSRFAAIGVIDPAVTDFVEQFRSRAAETGIQGLRIFRLGNPAVNKAEDLLIFPLLDYMEKGGYKIWYYSSPDQLPLLGKVLNSLPRLTIVFNHLGFTQTGFECDELGRPKIETEIPPPTLETVLAYAETFENTYVLFSGHYAFSQEEYPYYDLTGLSLQLYNGFGSDRMMWATDSPWILEKPGYARLMEITDHLLPGIPGRDKEKIMGDTAAELFFHE
jgi:predicted TIM-barrel fold metal-dependent hydrolase